MHNISNYLEVEVSLLIQAPGRALPGRTTAKRPVCLLRSALQSTCLESARAEPLGDCTVALGLHGLLMVLGAGYTVDHFQSPPTDRVSGSEYD